MSNKLVNKENKEGTNVLGITTFEDLKRYAKGKVVKLPSFAEGQPFVARIRRPSMLQMVKTGLIPNELLTRANSLFLEGGKGINKEDEAVMSQVFEVIEVICEEAFVEPTYKQIKESGVKLTDEQMMFIFNYSQSGVNALKSFRNKPRD